MQTPNDRNDTMQMAMNGPQEPEGVPEPSWTPPPRPEWVRLVNEEAASMDISAIIPLYPEELIATACRVTGLADFGDESWREPFHVLMESMEQQSELNLLGRIQAREYVLRSLIGRLQIEDTYKRHPEIDEEVIDAPLVVVGLPRSGTSILFELLSQDPQFGVLTSWESEEPCPPPEAATYLTDPRIASREHGLQRDNRITPSFRTMHERGALIPKECTEAFRYSFTSHGLTARSDMPDYRAYLATRANWGATFRYHKRLLKLLQWKNPRKHWLLKSPAHLWNLETLFDVFPDAKVILTHRDPVRANASGISLMGTLFWMRSDKPFYADSFAETLKPEATAAGLNRVIDQIETGAVPRERMFNSHYAELMRDPLATLRVLYGQVGLTLEPEAECRMQAYLDAKPKHKFGAHTYEVSDDPHARACYARYQQYYGVENEI